MNDQGDGVLDEWSLVYESFVPEHEGRREALCALGNGYWTTRGAAEESAWDDVHYPGTYRAGLYDRIVKTVAGERLEAEDLVNLPNWLPVQFRIERGPWLDLRRVEVLAFRQELRLDEALLVRAYRVRDDAGRETGVTSRRLVPIRHPHLAALEVTIRAYNWSGTIEVASRLDGRVENHNVDEYEPLAGRHLTDVRTGCGADGELVVAARTAQSGIVVAVAARTYATIGQHRLAPRREAAPDRVAGVSFTTTAATEDELRIEKVAALYSSRDEAMSESGAAATREARSAPSFAQLREEQRVAWQSLWRRCSVEIEGHGRLMGVVRLHLLHVLQALAPCSLDLDTAIAARGWTGEGYRGHIFWDELFVLPLASLRVPELTRSVLLYRYRRLDAARRAAAAAGLRGAMIPWRSGSDGREETERRHQNPRTGHWMLDRSCLQRHVGSAVAWNVWHYVEATGDEEFLASHGAEIILEIARFWASVARLDVRRDRYVIDGIVGPDEFHDAYPGATDAGIANNAYTNVMASWTLACALEVLERVPGARRAELEALLEVSGEELASWDRISRRLVVCMNDEGVIDQFEGYCALEEFDWERYRARYGDIHRLDYILDAEGDSTNRYQVSKQADVLMLFYLFTFDELRAVFDRLGYPLDATVVERNIDYYGMRTSHGSTLSRVVHAWVLARRDRAASWRMLGEALGSDLRDIQGGTTKEGVHLGAMAGAVDIVLRCYTGLDVRERALWLDPLLPDELTRLSMRVVYRSCELDVDLADGRALVRADAEGCQPIVIGHPDGRREQLEPGRSTLIDARSSDARAARG